MIKKAVIMCGGWATRFLPTSKGTPKELLPLYDTPILQVIVDDLTKNGIKEILFIIRQGKESIAKYFSRNIAFEEELKHKEEYLNKVKNYEKAKFYFTYQNFQRGTGDALLQAKEWVGNDTFILLNGDEIIQNTPSLIQQMLTKYHSTHTSIIGVYKVEDKDIEKYGIVDIKTKQNGLIKGIVEKPQKHLAPSNYANIGTYIFEPSFFNYIKSSDDMPITDALDLYIQKNYLYGAIIEGERYDLGSPLGYVLSNFSFALKNPITKHDTLEFLNKLGFYPKHN